MILLCVKSTWVSRKAFSDQNVYTALYTAMSSSTYASCHPFGEKHDAAVDSGRCIGHAHTSVSVRSSCSFAVSQYCQITESADAHVYELVVNNAIIY